MRRDVKARIWDRTNRTNGWAGCWLWAGSTTSNGYGSMSYQGKYQKVHRVAYEAFRGPISEGLVLDHLCRVKRCANPWHLEPVTQHVNVLRGNVGVFSAQKTHCPRGHEYDEANTRVYAGRRHCRACGRIWCKEYRTRKTAS